MTPPSSAQNSGTSEPGNPTPAATDDPAGNATGSGTIGPEAPAAPPNFFDTGWTGSRLFESISLTAADATLAMRQTGFLDPRSGDTFVRTYQPDGTWANDTATIGQIGLERTDETSWQAAPILHPTESPPSAEPSDLHAVPTSQSPIYAVDFDHALAATLNTDDLPDPSAGTEVSEGAGLQFAGGSALSWVRWWREGQLVAEEVTGWLEASPEASPIGVIQATAYVEPEDGAAPGVVALAEGMTGIDVASVVTQATLQIGVGQEDTGGPAKPAYFPADASTSPSPGLANTDVVIPRDSRLDRTLGPSVHTIANSTAVLGGTSSVFAVPAATVGMLGALSLSSRVFPFGMVGWGLVGLAVGGIVLYFLVETFEPVLTDILESTLAGVLDGLGGTATRPTPQPPPIEKPPPTGHIPRRPPLPDNALIRELVELYKEIAAAKGLDDGMADTAARACLASDIRQAFPAETSPCRHGVRILFIGGKDMPEHYIHINATLQKRPDWAQLTRRYPTPRRTIASDPICKAANVAGKYCDEYPFNSTRENAQGASLQAVNRNESNFQGGKVSAFYGDPRCQEFVDGTQFYVIPVEASITFHKCQQ